MAVERTLSIIKPDAVSMNLIGEIISRFEKSGLRVVAAKLMQLSADDAARFYSVHSQRPFFERLVTFMSSGPLLVQVLEGEDAIRTNRTLMGATNPLKAEPGTIRRDFCPDIDESEMHRNLVHGSDAPETAAEEIGFFFTPDEIFSIRAQPG